MEEMLKELKAQIEINISEIELIQIQIEKYFEHMDTKEKKVKLDVLISELKALFTENNQLIHMQLILISYIEKAKKTGEMINETQLFFDLGYGLSTEEDVIFNLTVNGELTFDQFHPMFGDKNFFNRLMDYNIATEAYEKCGELIEVKYFPYLPVTLKANDFLIKSWNTN